MKARDRCRSGRPLRSGGPGCDRAASTSATVTGRSGASARATSRLVRAARASPSTRFNEQVDGVGVRRRPPRRERPVGPRSSGPRRSSGSSRKRLERLSRGAFTEKYGFSVVAPMRVRVPSSTEGSSASCWVRLNRCTSSRNRMVPRPCWPSSVAGAGDDLTDVLYPGGDRRQGHEGPGGRPGDQLGQGRLAGARWAPQHDRRQAVGLDERPQRAAGAQQVVLADDLVEGPGPHPGRQRGLGGQALVDGLGRRGGTGRGAPLGTCSAADRGGVGGASPAAGAQGAASAAVGRSEGGRRSPSAVELGASNRRWFLMPRRTSARLSETASGDEPPLPGDDDAGIAGPRREGRPPDAAPTPAARRRPGRRSARSRWRTRSPPPPVRRSDRSSRHSGPHHRPSRRTKGGTTRRSVRCSSPCPGPGWGRPPGRSRAPPPRRPP